jgi:hypothetical protein
LGGGQRHYIFAIGQKEQAYFLAIQKLLNQNSIVDVFFCMFHRSILVLGDNHSLATCQSIGLNHIRCTKLAHGFFNFLQGFAKCCPSSWNLCLLHNLFGEVLASLQLGSFLGWTKYLHPLLF